MQNYLQNMVANLKNGQMAKKSFVVVNKNKNCEAVLNILWDEGFILGYCVLNETKLKVFLKYQANNKPVLSSVRLISQPSLPVYYSVKQLWKITENGKLLLMSTDLGLFSSDYCKVIKRGGEPLLILK
jgi:small subunit ribosomal protein S8